MPGAPNRPPTIDAPPAPKPPDDEAARRVLRRLAPSRVALLLDLWRGAPSPELLTPLARAEAAFDAGDNPGASGDLDVLAVRFAEPRWPTLPHPFRELRVAIPAPQPPNWDPDHALSPEEKEARRARRAAATQLALAEGVLAWLDAHGMGGPDAAALVETARGLAAPDGPTPAAYAAVDAFWALVRSRVPAPRPAGARPAPTPGT
ncbi:MAG TPA: hypothetical protein VMH78_03770 [Thermoplasmata archaeon]|nr:hypothetical protein [Thermoplasmata archaeon]